MKNRSNLHPFARQRKQPRVRGVAPRHAPPGEEECPKGTTTGTTQAKKAV